MQLFKGRSRRPDKPQKNGKGEGLGLVADAKFYRPSDKEPFMNERQREYFRLKLLNWREDILKEAKETLQHLQDESQNHPDLADRASSETDRYCEETGEPITLKRLEARPIATLSIEAQERHERRERVYRDD
jgi:DnaK suppressor protein